MMNIMYRCATRLIAASAFVIIIPTLAAASDVERDASFKLAMGPMSAAQKNQSNSTAEAAPAEPRLVPTHHPRRHHAHYRPRHHHAHHMR
jgi:hypothetical protein